MVKILLNCIAPKCCIINKNLFVFDVLCDVAEPVCIPVHGGQVALGGHPVPEPPPWCDEGGLVSVLHPQGHRVKRIPNVKDRFNLPCWNG